MGFFGADGAIGHRLLESEGGFVDYALLCWPLRCEGVAPCDIAEYRAAIDVMLRSFLLSKAAPRDTDTECTRDGSKTPRKWLRHWEGLSKFSSAFGQGILIGLPLHYNCFCVLFFVCLARQLGWFYIGYHTDISD